MSSNEPMSPELFIETVFQKIVEPNLIFYSEGYFNTPASEANNDVSRKILNFTSSLPIDQRGAFLLFTRVVIVDTISRLFGVIDGSSFFRSPSDDFQLTCLDVLLSGDLQSAFLEKEEDLEPSIIDYVDSLVKNPK